MHNRKIEIYYGETRRPTVYIDGDLVPSYHMLETTWDPYRGPPPDAAMMSPRNVAVNGREGKVRFELGAGSGFSKGEYVDVSVGGTTYRGTVDVANGTAFVEIEDAALCRMLDVDGQDPDRQTAKREPVADGRCDECFGTGRWNGFGGPCSRGCPQIG